MGVVRSPGTAAPHGASRPPSQTQPAQRFQLWPLGGAFLLIRTAAARAVPAPAVAAHARCPDPAPRAVSAAQPSPGREVLSFGGATPSVALARGGYADGQAAVAKPAHPAVSRGVVAYEPGEPEAEGLPALSTSAWTLLLIIVSALSALVAVACLAHVEVTTVADGVLRIKTGPRPVLAQVTGTLAELHVNAGDAVAHGQRMARLQATELVAERDKRATELALRERGQKRASKAAQLLHEGATTALKQKRAILEQRIQLKLASIAAQESRVQELEELARLGAGTRADALNARSLLAAHREELLSLRQQSAEIALQLSELANVYTTTQLNGELELEQSDAELARANALTQLTVIDAPVSGRVESLLVSVGQVVTSGTVVARIVPEGDEPLAVVFARARDAAFLREGLQASVELQALPVADFGRAQATVVRVASDLASDVEVAQMMGAASVTGEPLVRVELKFEDTRSWQRMSEHARSGARLSARLETQKRRLLSLVFDFMRRWFP